MKKKIEFQPNVFLFPWPNKPREETSLRTRSFCSIGEGGKEKTWGEIMSVYCVPGTLQRGL